MPALRGQRRIVSSRRGPVEMIDARYTAAWPAIERFLTTQGRRKFLKPIYEKLAKNPEDLAFARRIYAKARPTYHPVSQGTIDGIVNPTSG